MSVLPAKILLATDGSREATLAVRAAVDFSNTIGSKLHVVYVGSTPVVPATSPSEASLELRHGPPLMPGALNPVQQHEGSAAEPSPQEFLNNQVVRVREAGGEVAESYLRTGRPAEEIIGLAEDIDAGLIVTGSRGLSSLKRLAMGSTSETVVRYAPCSVLTVRGKWPEVFPERMLLATDGSEEAELAASTAADLAGKTGSDLHVLHVFDAPLLDHAYAEEATRVGRRAARELLDAQIERVREAGAEPAESYARAGTPVAEIISVGEEIEAGLIILGSRGTSEIKRLVLGSVSEGVTRHAPCSTLVVRHQESPGE